MKPYFLFAVPTALALVCSAVAAEPLVTTSPAAAGDGVQVGVAKRDGVTVSAGEAYVTRNRATEKLTKALVLPSGAIAHPDGTVTLPDKTETTLRGTQLLTFEGKIVEIPRDPNVNPPARNNNPTSGSSSASAQTGTATNPAMMGSAGERMPRDNREAASTIFVGSDNVPFTGSLRPDGSIVLADGTVRANDGTIRPVTFGQNGAPAFGTINPNGTVTRPDGAVIFPDGSVRSSDGTVIAPARTNARGPGAADGNANNSNPNNSNANTGTANNGNSNPGVPQNPNSQPTLNNGVASGSNTDSPRNTGTVNNPNRQGNPSGTSTNSGGTSTGSGSTGTTGGSGGARSTNGGTSNSGGSGTGTSGAGGASGGSAGGASR